MKRRSLYAALALALAFASVASAAENAPEEPFDRWNVGASGVMFLPGGSGNRLSRAGGVSADLGYDFTERWGGEMRLSSVPNTAGTALTGWEADAIFHAAGYERFDPFVTLGVGTVYTSHRQFEGGWSRFLVGPVVGVGAFYHLTDRWSLRFDARALVGLNDGHVCWGYEHGYRMMYGVSIGLRYSFGGE